MQKRDFFNLKFSNLQNISQLLVSEIETSENKNLMVLVLVILIRANFEVLQRRKDSNAERTDNASPEQKLATKEVDRALAIMIGKLYSIEISQYPLKRELSLHIQSCPNSNPKSLHNISTLHIFILSFFMQKINVISF